MTKNQFEKKRYRLSVGDIGVAAGESLVIDGDELARFVSAAIDCGFKTGFREGRGEKDVVVDITFKLNPRARISANEWQLLEDFLAARVAAESRG